MKKLKIVLNKPYATCKRHPRGKQIMMPQGMEFDSMISFMEYSGWSVQKYYGMLFKGIISAS